MKKRKFLTITTSTIAFIGAGLASIPLFKSWNVRADRIHDFDVTVDITGLDYDTILRKDWMGKPVIIYRRSKQDIENLLTIKDLRDPNSLLSEQPESTNNIARSIKPEIMVIIPICTHLGCEAPKSKSGENTFMGKNWKGGFFCPCHGSKFDLAGRVYQGVPAPVNMVVPPYMFKDENTIIIGREKYS